MSLIKFQWILLISIYNIFTQDIFIIKNREFMVTKLINYKDCKALNKTMKIGARGSMGGWYTMLQAARLWVPVLMRSLNFSNLLNPSSRIMALGFTQLLKKLSRRSKKKFLGSRVWTAHKGDNLTAIYEPIV
jgi:hypothetical protein